MKVYYIDLLTFLSRHGRAYESVSMNIIENFELEIMFGK
jgi:hypothetical protein